MRVIEKISTCIHKVKDFILFACIFLITSCTDEVAKVNDIKEYMEKELKVIGQGDSVPYEKQYWASELFKTFFNMLNDIYVGRLPFLTEISLKLLAVGFGIWLAVYSMRYVGALNNPNPVDYLNNVFKRGFVVMFVAAFLANAGAVQKLLDYTAILAMDFFSSTSVSIINGTMQATSGNSSMSGAMEKYTPCPEISLSSGGDTVDQNHLAGLKHSFACVIAEGHKQLVFGIAFGKLINNLAEGFADRVVGFFLFIFFTLIDFVLPLFLMDGLFKFMIAIILSPLFIAAWAFPSTRSYTKKAWSLVIGMGFQILFTVVFIAFAVVCVRTFGMNGENSVMAEFMNPATYASEENTKNFIETTKAIFAGNGKALSLMFAGLFLLILTDKVSGMAKDFSDAPATSIVSSTVKKFGAGLISIAVAAVAVIATGGLALKDKAKALAGKAKDAAMGTISEGMQ